MCEDWGTRADCNTLGNLLRAADYSYRYGYPEEAAKEKEKGGRGEVELVCTHPALRTAPVQLKEDAAVPVAFALYGDAMTLSPSSSSDTAVVRLIRSSSEICKMQTLQRRID